MKISCGRTFVTVADDLKEHGGTGNGVASEFSTERLPLRAAQGLALACLIGVKILYVLVGRSERRVAISSQ
jgi:hypothetical protein